MLLCQICPPWTWSGRMCTGKYTDIDAWCCRFAGRFVQPAVFILNFLIILDILVLKRTRFEVTWSQIPSSPLLAVPNLPHPWFSHLCNGKILVLPAWGFTFIVKIKGNELFPLPLPVLESGFFWQFSPGHYPLMQVEKCDLCFLSNPKALEGVDPSQRVTQHFLPRSQLKKIHRKTRQALFILPVMTSPSLPQKLDHQPGSRYPSPKLMKQGREEVSKRKGREVSLKQDLKEGHYCLERKK